MKRMIFGIIFTAILFGMPVYSEVILPTTQTNVVNAQATAQDIANFRQQMVNELNKQQKYVDQLGAAIQDTTISPMFINSVELGNALIQMDVKRTLVANFWNSTTLASPTLRSVMLQTLQKDVITQADLAYLQMVADTEKANLLQTQAVAPSISAPVSAPPTPATAPTPATSSVSTTPTIPLVTPNPSTPIPPIAPDTTLPATPGATDSGERVVY
jgi:hypothetical protein